MGRLRRRRSVELVQTCCNPSRLYGHTLYGRPLWYRTNAKLFFTHFYVTPLAVQGKHLGHVNDYYFGYRARMLSLTRLLRLMRSWFQTSTFGGVWGKGV